MKEFKGKVAVVTGAASGIGKCLALEFARRGCAVVMADIEQSALQAAEREVQALGARTLVQRGDVSNRAAMRELADAAFNRFGAVHILCNNAGVAVGGPLESARYEDWQWLMAVNVWGVIHGLDAFLPRMIAQKSGGHIVNTASMAASTRPATSSGLRYFPSNWGASRVTLRCWPAGRLRSLSVMRVVTPMGHNTETPIPWSRRSLERVSERPTTAYLVVL